MFCLCNYLGIVFGVAMIMCVAFFGLVLLVVKTGFHRLIAANILKGDEEYMNYPYPPHGYPGRDQGTMIDV